MDLYKELIENFNIEYQRLENFYIEIESKIFQNSIERLKFQILNHYKNTSKKDLKQRKRLKYAMMLNLIKNKNINRRILSINII